MRNQIGFNRLNRKKSHRVALHKNMVTSLILEERIKTTKAKAKEIRRTAEKLITRAKEDNVHNRRIAAKKISHKIALNKLFTDIGPRFEERPGGYTRMLKLGFRKGDAAEMVLLEFVDYLGAEEETTENKSSRKEKKAAKAAKAEDNIQEDLKAKETVKEEAEQVEAKEDKQDDSSSSDKAANQNSDSVAEEEKAQESPDSKDTGPDTEDEEAQEKKE